MKKILIALLVVSLWSTVALAGGRVYMYRGGAKQVAPRSHLDRYLRWADQAPVGEYKKFEHKPYIGPDGMLRCPLETGDYIIKGRLVVTPRQ